jgi:hypothetical protein
VTKLEGTAASLIIGSLAIAREKQARNGWVVSAMAVGWGWLILAKALGAASDVSGPNVLPHLPEGLVRA